MRDIIITIPKTIKWSDYEKELQAAQDGAIMNFKVQHLPKESGVGANCYIVYNGHLVGYMKICGLQANNFVCSTTGKHWEGNFIQRTGEITKFRGTIPYPEGGFRGWKYFDIKEFLNKK
jgi:hypothetical protein